MLWWANKNLQPLAIILHLKLVSFLAGNGYGFSPIKSKNKCLMKFKLSFLVLQLCSYNLVFLQMCYENGSSLPMDQQLLWSSQSLQIYIVSHLSSVWMHLFSYFSFLGTLSSFPCGNFVLTDDNFEFIHVVANYENYFSFCF